MNKIIICIFAMIPFTASAIRGVASIDQKKRLDHARELMGPSYKRSIVSRMESATDMEKNIFKTVEARLPKAYKKQAKLITNTIIKEAKKHHLDPYFVMAVISGESSFNPLAKGPVGEIGMMQLRFKTGEWMAEMTKSNWNGDKTLRNPIANIKLGTAYLAWLRTKFNGHGQLYVAAYNMGAKNVKQALEKNITPKDYPLHVMKRYVAFYRGINDRQ